MLSRFALGSTLAALAAAKAWKGLGYPIMNSDNAYIAYVDQFYQFNVNDEEKVVTFWNDITVNFKAEIANGDQFSVWSCISNNNEGQ